MPWEAAAPWARARTGFGMSRNSAQTTATSHTRDAIRERTAFAPATTALPVSRPEGRDFFFSPPASFWASFWASFLASCWAS